MRLARDTTLLRTTAVDAGFDLGPQPDSEEIEKMLGESTTERTAEV